MTPLRRIFRLNARAPGYEEEVKSDEECGQCSEMVSDLQEHEIPVYECPICLEEGYSVNSSTHKCEKCGQYFHTRCLGQWELKQIDRNRNLVCPLCGQSYIDLAITSIPELQAYRETIRRAENGEREARLEKIIPLALICAVVIAIAVLLFTHFEQ